MPSHEQIKAMLRERQEREAAERAKAENNNIEDGNADAKPEEAVADASENVTEHEASEDNAKAIEESVQENAAGTSEAGSVQVSTQESVQDKAQESVGEPVQESRVEEMPAEPVKAPVAPVAQATVAAEPVVVRMEPAPPKKQRSAGRPKARRAEKPKPEVTVKRVDLPASLVSMAIGMVPDAANKSDAVAAWMYAKSDQTVDVPDYIKELSRCCLGDQTVNILKDINEHLASMDARTRSFNALSDGKMQELWYMMAYLMLERMDEIHSPGLQKLDLAQPVFDTLMSTMKQQVARERNRLRNQQGRTIR